MRFLTQGILPAMLLVVAASGCGSSSSPSRLAPVTLPRGGPTQMSKPPAPPPPPR